MSATRHAAPVKYKDGSSGYQWVCPACFEDLKDELQWTATCGNP